ncbi:MAG: hypothetical protein IPJ65_05600 [Archangiaceae bacterium]|nr:hypothetical protein [Archangiaceae bacterium]
MVPLLISLVVISQAGTPLPGAPSDEPTPAAEVAPPQATAPSPEAEKKADDRAPVLKGLDLALTVFNSTGTYFGPEGYTNSFTFWLEPSFAIGKVLFNGTWFEKLAVSARLPIEFEVAGNDPRFRGTGFASSALFNPEALPIVETQAGAADGTEHRAALLGDLWLTVAHGHLFTIPLLNIDVASSLRTALPTSIASRNAGLIASLGLGLIFERKFFDRLSLGYAFRPTKYFFSRQTGGVAALGTSVTINGRTEQTWTPSSTGIPNPDFGFINGFWASLDLPKGFGVSVNYFLFNTRPYDVSANCNPIGMQGVDVCRDGQAVNPNIEHAVWRNEHWFLASVDYHRSFWSLALGISTFRPVESTRDRSPTQPFFESNRNNYTTLYLSFSANAEGIAGWVTGRASSGETK